jgi:hypothetical protein
MRTESGGYRRDHLRALAQRVEVDAKQLRIMGSKSVLLRTLVAASGAKTAGFGVPSSVPKWRARRDSNYRFHLQSSDEGPVRVKTGGLGRLMSGSPRQLTYRRGAANYGSAPMTDI